MKYFISILIYFLGFSASAQFSREFPSLPNTIVEIPNLGTALIISPNSAVVAWIDDPQNIDYGKNISSQLRIRTKNKKPGLFFENELLKYDFNLALGENAVQYNIGHLKQSVIGLRLYIFEGRRK